MGAVPGFCGATQHKGLMVKPALFFVSRKRLGHPLMGLM